MAVHRRKYFVAHLRKYFADDFFRSDVPHAKQMLDVYNSTGKSVVSLIEVEPKDSTKYGMGMSKTLMSELNLVDGDVVYFRMS